MADMITPIKPTPKNLSRGRTDDILTVTALGKKVKRR
jgi:hypothetical protein